MIRIKLTKAQIGALQQQGLEEVEDLSSDERALALAWVGNYLVFDERDARAVWGGLIDRSNTEDDEAENTTDREARKWARLAARNLANLATKVSKVIP